MLNREPASAPIFTSAFAPRPTPACASQSLPDPRNFPLRAGLDLATAPFTFSHSLVLVISCRRSSSTRLSHLVLALGLAFSAVAPAPAQEIIDGIAAVVNGDVITFSQVRELVRAREQQLRQSLSGKELVDKVKELREGALQDLIDRQLILQEFKKQGLQLPDYVIEEHVQSIIRTDFGGDRAAFQRTLAAQGYTMAQFRDIERDKIVVQAMRRKSLGNTPVISPGKVESYYTENRKSYASDAKMQLRLITLGKNSGESPESQKKMVEEIREKIVAGGDFGKMAELYSEDSSSAIGGDWGWIDSGTLNPDLSKAAFSLDAGEVSRVLEFGDSYYLLYSEAKKNAEVKPLQAVRNDIESKLRQELSQAQQEKWLQDLRKKAYIKKY